MDLYKNGVMFPQSAGSENAKFGNTVRFGNSRRSLGVDLSIAPDDGCSLVLGLGPTPSAYSGNSYGVGVNKNKGYESKYDSILRLGLSGGTTFSMFECSGSRESDVNSSLPKQMTADDHNGLRIPVVDEGSTSAKKSGGYMPSLLLAPRMADGKSYTLTRELLGLGTEFRSHRPQLIHEPSASTDFSMDSISDQATFRSSGAVSSKKCRFAGCSKGARGGTGLCIGHGGGQRCQKEGCNKGAESRTAFCRAHGGGNRCQNLGCTKSAEGNTDHCIAHGGGRRCKHPGGCQKAARGKSGLCIRHGGGKRCKVSGCTRSAEGQAGLCISHGGGRRCQFLECTKGAQGSTMFCKAHGGGKRCVFAGCTKGAEGSTPLCKGHGGGKRCLFDGGGICPKSVHGCTDFCVAHGGGKRCSVAGCTRSARGRTDCCVRHGGGKRCKFENCGKSAQGSTDCCKAHGGGKRCGFGGDARCEKFARGKSGLCAAHCSMVQGRETSSGLFRGLVSNAGSSLDYTHSSSGVSVVSDCVDSSERLSKRQHRLPLEFAVPEGRVHGGALMSLFGGNLKNAAVNGV